MRASNLARKLIALNVIQKVFNFCKIYTPKFLGCYTSMGLGLDNCVGYELIPHLGRVGCGSDNHRTFFIPPRSDVVIGVLKVARGNSYLP
jgi:hypothetical protein